MIGSLAAQTIEKPCQTWKLRDFHNCATRCRLIRNIRRSPQSQRKAASSAGSARSVFGGCTKCGHGAVHGVHSIENTCTYKRVFLID